MVLVATPTQAVSKDVTDRAALAAISSELGSAIRPSPGLMILISDTGTCVSYGRGETALGVSAFGSGGRAGCFPHPGESTANGNSHQSEPWD